MSYAKRITSLKGVHIVCVISLMIHSSSHVMSDNISALRCLAEVIKSFNRIQSCNFNLDAVCHPNEISCKNQALKCIGYHTFREMKISISVWSNTSLIMKSQRKSRFPWPSRCFCHHMDVQCSMHNRSLDTIDLNYCSTESNDDSTKYGYTIGEMVGCSIGAILAIFLGIFVILKFLQYMKYIRISIENNILTGTDNNTSDDVTSDGIYNAVDHMIRVSLHSDTDNYSHIHQRNVKSTEQHYDHVILINTAAAGRIERAKIEETHSL
ncbi:uncharacterized protein LOC125655102 [Ostrea edulis]|uniref:uncharacterized protein LOC125655102 n=1 Tax=Ostrea edulis TaxID=37623 RepID=UPI0024AF0BDD|nr:uncharacterized protein LOC125655102 [Ostrea edulis]